MARFLAIWVFVVAVGTGVLRAQTPDANDLSTRVVDRSPVDLVLTPDDQWILTANQGSQSVSLVRLSDGKVADEIHCGPASAIALAPNGHTVLVTAGFTGTLSLVELADARLKLCDTISLGFEPRGVAVSPDGKLAYVALSAAAEVAVVDLEARQVLTKIAVGRWPRTLALSPDGTRLAVGCSGDGGISVVDTVARKRLYESKFLGLNIGQMQVSADGVFAYFPWMVYADRPISVQNIKNGWVMGNRLARVRLDGPARREALALDPRGHGVGDPHGLTLAPHEDWLVVTAAGTAELLVLRLADLPLSTDGTGDHMKEAIWQDSDRYYRVPLSGRPLAVRSDRSGRRVYVANALENSVQVVDLERRELERTISLGPASVPSPARQGERIFFDARRSTDGWYSCHSCHYEGGSNALTMDTRNDGSNGTFKMVLPLVNLSRTGPWFWHGIQSELPLALRKSLVETMQGPEPTADDMAALAAYLDTLSYARNSRGQPDGNLAPAARRGLAVFQSEVAACANCHGGPLFTDGQNHDLGLASDLDVYKEFNTPSLLGVGNRINFLHHGRAKSLEQLLTGLHDPAKVSMTRSLTTDELADLVEYLKSL